MYTLRTGWWLPCGLVGLTGIGLFAGCQPTEAPALTQTQQNAPTFFEISNDSSQTPTAETSSRFLIDGLLAAATLDLEDLRNSPQLAGIDWQALERLLANWVGPSLSKLSRYERVWILLDPLPGNFGDSRDPAANSWPMAIILEALQPIEEELPADRRRVTATEGVQVIPLQQTSWHFTQINPQVVAIGSQNLLARLRRGDDGPLQSRLNQNYQQATLNVVVDLQPLAGFLKTAAQIAQQFGGDEASQLLLAITHLALTGDLQSDDLLQVEVGLDGPQMVDRLAQLLNESFSRNSSSGNGLNGLGGLAGLSNARGPQLLVPESPKLLEKLMNEIQTRGLAVTTKTKDSVQIKIRRAESFDSCLVAIITDAQRQIELTRRMGQMQEIAAAALKYQKRQGHWPWDQAPGGTHPYSWRVALLPDLGREDLYERFDFQLPWDHPTNLQTAEEIPGAFASSTTGSATRFRAAVGPGRAFPNPRQAPVTTAEITDSKARTAVFVEVAADLAVPWTAPDEPLPSPLNDNQAGAEYEQGWMYVDAELALRAIRKSDELIQAVLTIAGGEKIGRQDAIPLDVAPDASTAPKK